MNEELIQNIPLFSTLPQSEIEFLAKSFTPPTGFLILNKKWVYFLPFILAYNTFQVNFVNYCTNTTA